jgi:hypothetical protein
VDDDLTSAIEISGEPDTSVAGEYTIRYSVLDTDGNLGMAFRAVVVEDLTPPEVILLGSNPRWLYCTSSYIEFGATATDDCGGPAPTVVIDASEVEIHTVGTYTVYYTATDSAGNVSATVGRTVNISDYSAPKITPVGTPSVVVSTDEVYVDAGATATDDCDTNLPEVTADTSAVDFATPGRYTEYYRVTDSSGRTGQAERIIQVYAPDAPPIRVEVQLHDYSFCLDVGVHFFPYPLAGGMEWGYVYFEQGEQLDIGCTFYLEFGDTVMGTMTVLLDDQVACEDIGQCTLTLPNDTAAQLDIYFFDAGAQCAGW